MAEQLPNEFLVEIKRNLSGEIRTDPATRLLFSTDASIHQIKPFGVVFPRSQEELQTIVQLAAKYKVPLIPRGSGSSLAGQCIGEGLVVDCSRYLNRIIAIHPGDRTVVVEPGVILDDLNRALKSYQLQFGPDPASSERATLGGCIGNNSAGAHSIRYGMTADNILAMETVLADGSRSMFHSMNVTDLEHRLEQKDHEWSSAVEHNLYQAVWTIRQNYKDEIKHTWPLTWRRASGYNLNYLLPWSATHPLQWPFEELPYPPTRENMINLAQIMVGSEGSLGILQNATLRLVPLIPHSKLAVINFESIRQACDMVPEILQLQPAAVELVPRSLIHLAKEVPAYASQLGFITGDPQAILIIEFAHDLPTQIDLQLEALKNIHQLNNQITIAETAQAQKQVWSVRKVGLGILMSRMGDIKPIPFIEDVSIPVEKLGEFIQELELILRNHGTEADIYGHASVGCLHIRPLINLKTLQGKSQLRSIAEAVVDLVLRMRGAVSGEHGNGITRGEWIQRAHGPRIMEAFGALKKASDPDGILNPGKIIDTPRMDQYLRYEQNYHPVAWTPVFAYGTARPDQYQLIEAIEQCNGAGVCRKSAGVMCPSFQATGEEIYSTRGRSNLLRSWVANQFVHQDEALNAVWEALDKCLACKGCKAECPSSVDMAKLKYEVEQYIYTLRGHHRPVRDYLFGYIDQLAKAGHLITPLGNLVITHPILAGFREKMFGISRYRRLPTLSQRSFHQQAGKLLSRQPDSQCILLMDAFNEFFYPQVGMDAVRVLNTLGIGVKLLKTIGAGRPLISKGFLAQARKHALRLLDEIDAVDPTRTLPVIGLEPSEIYTLKDEFMDLLPQDPRASMLATRAFMMDELLLRPGKNGERYISKFSRDANRDNRTEVLFHGHCYQKAQPPATDGLPVGVEASVKVLELAGYAVKVIDDGCCGMAGAFGYEREHYQLSRQVGELSLMPAINENPQALISAAGISCQAQIQDGTGRKAWHPISLVAQAIDIGS